MNITLQQSLSDIPPAQWNRLSTNHNPFLRYEYLYALEQHGAIGPGTGWLPQYLLAENNGNLVGAIPMYLKDHSFGEFVFDWAWASAYERAGLDYYPKLIIAVPYTPVTGPRILLSEAPDQHAVAEALINKALEHARSSGVSSLHCLFSNNSDTQRLKEAGLMLRTGCQFHWENNGYRDFDDFLDHFSSKKRKKIKRERRRVIDAGIEIDIIPGKDISEQQWETFHHFYQTTFMKKMNYAPLTAGFFKALGESMPDNIILILARENNHYVAGAINFCGSDTLYGRHWGCTREFHSLHFEVCYYQAIEYCIQHGKRRFEAGAQGEHKLGRGFFPTPTHSTHWISNPAFQQAINDFLAREQLGMQHYMQELQQHLPYKSNDNICPSPVDVKLSGSA